MTDQQERIVRRFQRLVGDARKAGLVVAADADAIAIRLIPKEEADATDDIRQAGEIVYVDNACGGGGSKVSGLACNYGNS